VVRRGARGNRDYVKNSVHSNSLFIRTTCILIENSDIVVAVAKVAKGRVGGFNRTHAKTLVCVGVMVGVGLGIKVSVITGVALGVSVTIAVIVGTGD